MEDKRVAVELWKAKVPLKRIREQLGMSEATLRGVLGHAKKRPSCPVKKRKPGSGKKKIITLNEGNSTKYKPVCSTHVVCMYTLKFKLKMFKPVFVVFFERPLTFTCGYCR
jgi:hypothetical protein